MKTQQKQPIDPMFDGHLENEFKHMTPKEKLEYLSNQMEFKFFVRTKVYRSHPNVIYRKVSHHSL